MSIDKEKMTSEEKVVETKKKKSSTNGIKARKKALEGSKKAETKVEVSEEKETSTADRVEKTEKPVKSIKKAKANQSIKKAKANQEAKQKADSIEFEKVEKSEEKPVKKEVKQVKKERTKEDIAAERALKAKAKEKSKEKEENVLAELSSMKESTEEGTDSIVKQHKKLKLKKGLAIAVIAIVVVCGAIYGAGVAFFGSHFVVNTTVNGQKVSFKTVADVEQLFADEVNNYTLVVKERGDKTEQLSGKDFSINYEAGDSIDQIMQKQKPSSWVSSLFHKNNVDTPLEVSYDRKQLKTAVKALNCMNKANMEKPVVAHPVYDGEKYVIEKEVLGTTISGKLMMAAIEEAVTGLESEIDLDQADVYKKPKYTSESKKVKKTAKKMNTFLSAKITYKIHDSEDTITVDKKQLVDWVKTNETMKISFDKDAISAFVEELAGKCNSNGATMKFTKANGKEIKISGYDFGYRVDVNGEYAALVKDIKSGKEVTREPEYSARGDNGIGDTYAEVDLKNQVMYFYKNGKQVLKSDVVTGNPGKGNATPPGLFKLAYKQKDKVLRGEKKEDGTYEYESPVSYWMPFNGGIGFHDATWQSAFGGERYKTFGSHGCVNMPLENAKKLYNLIEPGMPVILYK